MEYRVRQDRGCQSPKGVYYGPGAKVDPEEFGMARLAELIAGGYLVASDSAKSAPPSEREGRTGRTGRVTPSKWAADPASLEGRTLDELNVMVAEVDAAVEPFEDAAEAIGWLSQDYEPED